MPLLFAVTLFVSAALLFCIQPMIAKMVLPLLGGSPAVWNTCLVFFQAALLGGYLYAHAATRWLGSRGQAILHLSLLGAAILVLPVGLSADLAAAVPTHGDPVFWVLGLLLVSVGLPFFVVAASAPLLQRWFAASGRDPYFLYAASNLGSMIALLGYPILMEPNLRLAEQGRLWAIGYGMLLALTLACAIFTWRMPHGELAENIADTTPERLTLGRRFRWVVLALVPSSLLMGVTSYVTMDIAAIPLLWVMPLALYLLTFILVFSPRPILSHQRMARLLPLVVMAAAFTLLTAQSVANLWLIPLHWLTLFVAAMVCHGELARDRPSPAHLTEFYLWLSFGGVLGGLFTALVAPLVFQGRALEYPLMLLLACLLRPGPGLRDSSSLDRWLDLLLPCAVCVLVTGIALGLRASEVSFGWAAALLLFGLPAVVCYLFVERPLRFAAALAGGLFALAATSGGFGRTLHAERNFFGLLRVQDTADRKFRQLNHGSTIHGSQHLGPDGQPLRDGPPTAYFHRSGPIGEVFGWLRRPGGKEPLHVAVTGLGAGTLASYARKGDAWTFYEIDPSIERVAQDQRYFTYLDDAAKRGAGVSVVVGDARLRLRDAAEHRYDLIVLDAFSSDAVPAHLISREALRLYIDRRAAHGLLVFNISNRYLDLEPVLAALARDAGMVAFSRLDRDVTPEQAAEGKSPSQWVVLADADADLGPIIGDDRWKRLDAPPGARAWDDDFSNLLSVFRWR